MPRSLISAALLAALLAPPARASLVLTGYGDLRFEPGARARVYGDPAALAAVGASDARLEFRGFSADAVGLFTATELREGLQFLMDITYRDVATDVGRLQLQYAYLDYVPLEDTTLRGGRLTLPLGYYNENRFYPFRRYQIRSQIFPTAILGLPIADWGVSASQAFPGERATLRLTAFAVNGYGNAAGDGDVFRRPIIPASLSAAQALSRNQRPEDNNHKQSFGGRIALTELGGADAETGFSYYRGDWNAAGTQPLQMMFAHVHAAAAGLDLTWEGLRLDGRGDRGFTAAVGSPDWTTLGHAATVSYRAGELRRKPVTPFVQGEDYRTRAAAGGGAEERLRTVGGGAAVDLTRTIRLKAEYLRLYYRLPVFPVSGTIRVTADVFNLAVVMTY